MYHDGEGCGGKAGKEEWRVSWYAKMVGDTCLFCLVTHTISCLTTFIPGNTIFKLQLYGEMEIEKLASTGW